MVSILRQRPGWDIRKPDINSSFLPTIAQGQGLEGKSSERSLVWQGSWRNKNPNLLFPSSSLPSLEGHPHWPNPWDRGQGPYPCGSVPHHRPAFRECRDRWIWKHKQSILNSCKTTSQVAQW